MSFRLQTSRWIYRYFSADSCSPFKRSLCGFASGEKSKIFESNEFRYGKAIVNFEKVNIFWTERCHLEGLASSENSRAERSKIASLVQSSSSSRSTGAEDFDRSTCSLTLTSQEFFRANNRGSGAI